MRIQNKVTRKGAQIESFIVGKNPFRLSEYIIVNFKRETKGCPSPYTVEILTSEKIGEDMDWSNNRPTHWTGYQMKLIEAAGGKTRSYGHIVWEAGFKSYNDASVRLKEALQLGKRLIKQPEFLH